MITRQLMHRRRRHGAVIVEAAMVLPILMLLMFGIFEYGRFMLIRNVIDHAAREGARHAVVRVAGNQTQTEEIIDFVEQKLVGMEIQLEDLTIEVYKADPGNGSNIGAWQDAAFGETIAVRISGNYRPITAAILLMPTTIPTETRCIMKSEAN